MNVDFESDDAVIQIRNKLQIDKIKLWLPPYYVDTSGSCHEELQVL